MCINNTIKQLKFYERVDKKATRTPTDKAYEYKYGMRLFKESLDLNKIYGGHSKKLTACRNHALTNHLFVLQKNFSAENNL